MPNPPHLAEAEIHVWSVSVDHPPVPHAHLVSYLSPQEHTRAARLATGTLRNRFETAHGLTRWILASYLDQLPEALVIAIAPGGKPFLEGVDLGGRPLFFNISHSAHHFLMGVALGAPIGVDVERVRSVQDRSGVARRFFSPWEADRLLGLPIHRQERAFFECWTRKEAFVKAVGDGLRIPLDSFEVAFGPQTVPALRRVNASAEEAAPWSLWGFDVEGGSAIGAVAVRETGWSLRRVTPPSVA